MKIGDLASPEYKSVLDRAEDRIEETILFGAVTGQSDKDEVEIPSFPIAVMMVATIGVSFLKRRYALAEARRASNLLRNEREDKITLIANNFNWKIDSVEDPTNSLTYDFTLHYTDFLRNATGFHDKKWKLVNKRMSNGEVCLTKNDVVRLLEEEIRRYIEGKLDTDVGSLPETLMNRVNRLKRLLREKRGEARPLEPSKEVLINAFPPCIRELHGTITSGRNISHIGRFTLTSFLINIGMATEDVVNLFRSLPDFNERLTRYQVEHIAGGRGSRTKYVPPRCDTLRTHGVCPSMDDVCRKVYRPLAYYRRKLRVAQRSTSEEET
ncbi:MAG: DNA primase large subunit PriL [Candidatus Bathyarchaeota archaeon]|nr:MAG: DNA primase large subunit PriL [Candidatus Bathyarchaeota archaeon]